MVFITAPICDPALRWWSPHQFVAGVYLQYHSIDLDKIASIGSYGTRLEAGSSLCDGEECIGSVAFWNRICAGSGRPDTESA
jgi:hypothetical protein